MQMEGLIRIEAIFSSYFPHDFDLPAYSHRLFYEAGIYIKIFLKVFMHTLAHLEQPRSANGNSTET